MITSRMQQSGFKRPLKQTRETDLGFSWRRIMLYMPTGSRGREILKEPRSNAPRPSISSGNAVLMDGWKCMRNNWLNSKTNILLIASAIYCGFADSCELTDI